MIFNQEKKYSIKIRGILAVLFIFIPIVFNPWGFEVFSLPRVFLLYFIALISIVLFFFQAYKENSIKFKINFIAYPLATFSFFILLSTITSKDKYTALWGYPWDYEGLLTWMCYLSVFYFGYIYFRRVEYLKKLFKYLAFPVFVVSLFAILQYFFNWELMQWYQKTEIRRASSLLGHPSYLGVYYLLYLPLIFYAFKTENNRRYRIFLTITILLGVIGLILSFSRGAWIAFLSMVVVYFFGQYKYFFKIIIREQYKKAIFFLGILLVAFVFFKFLSFDLFQQIGKRFISIFDPNSPTTQVRGYLYRQSFDLLAHNWLFGIGPDNYAYMASRFFSKNWDAFHEMTADKAHNQILDYWISFGIGGILSFMAFLYLWFRKIIQNIIKSKNDITALISIIAVTITGYLISMQFHYSSVDLSPLFWFLVGSSLGVLVNEGKIKEREITLIKKTDKHWDKSIIIIFTFSIITAIFLIYFSFEKISADYYFIKGLKNESSLEANIKSLESSIKRNHHMTNYRLALNSLYLAKGRQDNNSIFYEKAIDGLIESRKYIPLDYRLSYELGETYLKIIGYVQNKNFVYNKAKEAYLETLRLYPNSVDSNLKLGVVFAYLGENDQAVKFWEKCVELKSTQSQCYYNLYLIYQKIGNKNLSDINYQKYLDLNIKK
jgi:O-antigen ligase